MFLPILFKDGYKVDHRRQYPKGTELIYSNLTPRTSRVNGVDKVVVFGIKYFIEEYLVNRFSRDFFNLPRDAVVNKYKRRIDNYLGPDAVPIEHIRGLHDLGYLPLRIKALPEGSLCPLRVPMLTIVNTQPQFFWLTNFLETILCNVVWGGCTSATTAYQYRKTLDKFAAETSDIPEFVDWQGHDFSMRGMMGFEAAMISGAGHLLSFTGTDTIPAIDFLEEYYGANSDKELIGGSVPATEHSVCSFGVDNEYGLFKRLILEVYPKGVVSIVSDTFDYWKVLIDYLPRLKPEIMSRDGKLVIRPDSGDPVKIICGDPDSPDAAAKKGSAQLLWETFGGTINSKGYKQLDPHIGLIYGDSITLDRCKAICEGLKAQGFASTNIVFGIGSFTYQFVTRDTYGFAMKATYALIDGQPVELYKDPKTDSGIKKSARGLLRVNEDYSLSEGVSWEEEKQGLLQTVFEDGWVYTSSLNEIRNRLKSYNES